MDIFDAALELFIVFLIVGYFVLIYFLWVAGTAVAHGVIVTLVIVGAGSLILGYLQSVPD